VEPLTPASAGTILTRLTDTLDDCRHLLVSRAPAVSRKTTAGGSEETVTDLSATQHALAELRPFWESLEVAAVVPTPGFVAKLATVLLGGCHAALSLPVRPRRTAIWDYAAAALPVSEAGNAHHLGRRRSPRRSPGELHQRLDRGPFRCLRSAPASGEREADGAALTSPRGSGGRSSSPPLPERRRCSRDRSWPNVVTFSRQLTAERLDRRWIDHFET
jgi:hypothetical protein